jgi:hypothetical protein
VVPVGAVPLLVVVPTQGPQVALTRGGRSTSEQGLPGQTVAPGSWTQDGVPACHHSSSNGSSNFPVSVKSSNQPLFLDSRDGDFVLSCKFMDKGWRFPTWLQHFMSISSSGSSSFQHALCPQTNPRVLTHSSSTMMGGTSNHLSVMCRLYVRHQPRACTLATL